MAMWLIYCWHDRLMDDHPSYLEEITELAQQSINRGNEVHIEKLDFSPNERLCSQMDKKVIELKANAGLRRSDRCVLFISRTLVPGKFYLEEQAYSLAHSNDYPRDTFPCIGWCYI